MPLRPVCFIGVLALASLSLAAAAAQVDDATAVTMAAPHELVVAGDLTPAQRAASLRRSTTCTASGTTAARTC